VTLRASARAAGILRLFRAQRVTGPASHGADAAGGQDYRGAVRDGETLTGDVCKGGPRTVVLCVCWTRVKRGYTFLPCPFELRASQATGVVSPGGQDGWLRA
jgi:hypothetical protein